MDGTQSCVGFAECFIERNGSEDPSFRIWEDSAWWQMPQMSATEPDVRNSCVCRRMLRILLQGELEILHGSIERLWSPAPPVSSFKISLMRFGVDLPRARQMRLLLWGELQLDLPSDRRHNLVLQREYVAQFTLVAIGPQEFLCTRIDELRGDPHPVAHPHH